MSCSTMREWRMFACCSTFGTLSEACFYSGVMGPAKDMLTVEGYDLQFGTNVIG